MSLRPVAANLVLVALFGCSVADYPKNPEATMPRSVIERLEPPAAAAKSGVASRSLAVGRARASRSAANRTATGRSLGQLDVTAYCEGTRTASGKRPRPGMAATLDRRIRFGTRLLIAGRVYVVEDRIGNSSDVDLWFDDCSDAIRWGRRRLNVVVLP